MQVLCFGDSNTYGYDPRSYFGGRYAPEDRWVDILAERTGWQVCNQGLNGREIPRQAVPIPPGTDRAILMLGTNDLLQGCAPAAAADRMAAFLTGLPLPRERLFWVAPPPLAFGEWVQTQRLIDDSIVFARLCREKAVELGIPFGDAGRWGVALAYDGVHFTEEGHRAFAEGLYKEIIV